MSIDFDAIARQTNGILTELGLYDTVTYVEEVTTPGEYNPIAGNFGEETTSTIFTFQAVVLTEGNANEPGANSFGLGQQLIVVPSQIKFELSTEQTLTIDGKDWIVESFNLAPKDTIYTINIRRK